MNWKQVFGVLAPVLITKFLFWKDNLKHVVLAPVVFQSSSCWKLLKLAESQTCGKALYFLVWPNVWGYCYVKNWKQTLQLGSYSSIYFIWHSFFKWDFKACSASSRVSKYLLSEAVKASRCMAKPQDLSFLVWPDVWDSCFVIHWRQHSAFRGSSSIYYVVQVPASQSSSCWKLLKLSEMWQSLVLFSLTQCVRLLLC